MSIPNYLYALANHKGPATVAAGNIVIPVKIMDIQHKSERGMSDECTFKCMVVNQDQIRTVNPGINYRLNGVVRDDYVARALAESVARKRRSEGVLRRSGRYPWGLEIDRVIFNNPATIVFWADGTKTVVKCQEGDVYSKETGLALCIAKKALGNKGNFNDIFREWIPEEAACSSPSSLDERWQNLRDRISQVLGGGVVDGTDHHVKDEVPEKKEGCSYCSCATRTDKRFIVHTPSDLEIETVFNYCPVCGRKIPEVGRDA